MDAISSSFITTLWSSAHTKKKHFTFLFSSQKLFLFFCLSSFYFVSSWIASHAVNYGNFYRWKMAWNCLRASADIYQDKVIKKSFLLNAWGWSWRWIMKFNPTISLILIFNLISWLLANPLWFNFNTSTFNDENEI